MFKKELVFVFTLMLFLFTAPIVVAQEGPPQNMLLLLPVPQPEAVPARLQNQEDYTHHAAQPVLEELATLEKQGEIVGFELLPDKHAIRVTATDTDVLRDLQGISGWRPMDEGLPCAEMSTKALQTILMTPELAKAQTVSPQATNPSIYVVYDSDWGRIYGHTDPNTEVSLVLRNNAGATKVNQTTTSDTNGFYAFYPTHQMCIGYPWLPEPGDTVVVTANGNTVSTTVVEVSATANPTTNAITGATAANRQVTLRADQTAMDCNYTSGETTVTSDENGNFSATLSNGFDRSVGITALVFDENQNSTQITIYPSRLELSYNGNPRGYLKPNVSYTASLKRGATTLETRNGTTDDTGWFSTYFPTSVQAGDVIEVSGGGESLQMTYVTADQLAFDLIGDQITGSLGSEGAGRTVHVEPRNPWSLECNSSSSCDSTTADSSGNFTLNFASADFDLKRGYYDYDAVIYDANGNYQELRGELRVPIVEVNLWNDHVGGTWFEPGVAITATLRDSSGTLKESDTDNTSSYDASFGTYLSGDIIQPGDRVDVTDGAYTMTVASVPALTAYLDAGTDTVSGESPDTDDLTLFVWKMHLDSSYGTSWWGRCKTATASAGTYSSGVADLWDIQGQDHANVSYRDPDGHIAEVTSHAFTVNAEKGANYLHGDTPAPHTEVAIELWRDGGVQASTVVTSSERGYFDDHLTGMTIQQGDTVRVTPTDISPYDLEIPELTVQEEPAHNRVVGRAPSNASLEVELRQVPTWDYWDTLVTVDAAGDYVATFDGIYNSDCDKADVGACTQPEVTYYNPDGHSVWIEGTVPPNVSADAYENDDVYTDASGYTGLQSHTFHAWDDVDWISFTVSSEDLGSAYYLQTTNLGPNANTELYLYDTDGTSLLASNLNYVPASSQIAWSPTLTGTYYAKVEPYSSSYATECGSTYDFFIARHRVFLPLVMRSSP